jgi:hypothetical protein
MLNVEKTDQKIAASFHSSAPTGSANEYGAANFNRYTPFD